MSVPASEPARVLRVIARLNVGGPAIQVVNLSRRLTPLGYATVLLRGRLGPAEGSMDHLAAELGVVPIDLPGLRRELGLHDLRALWSMCRWLSRYRPDVLHTHTAKAGAIGRLAALVLAGRRPPVVIHTFHGHVFEGEFSSGVSRLFAFVERLLARGTTRIVAVSSEIRQDLIDLRVAPAEKVQVLPLGFDLDRFVRSDAEREEIGRHTRARLGIPDGKLVVTVIARVVKVKRIDRFLAMATELAAERDDVHFVIVGDGDRRAELQASADARRLGDRVTWAGFERDVASLCFASDIVVLSSDNEGTPVSLIEAHAAGRPAVCTRAGGVAAVIVNGTTGFVVPKDAGALAAAVRTLLDDPQMRRRFGEAGRRHVLERFSVERLVADIDELYSRLLGEYAAARPRR